MDCAAIAEWSITKVTVRVATVILWSRILVNFVSVMAVFWSPIGRTAVLRTVHFLLAVVILSVKVALVVVVARAVNNVTVVFARTINVVIVRTVYVAASRTVVGNVAVVVITVIAVVVVWAVNVNAALGSYVTHVVIVITAFVDIGSVPSVT